MGRRDRALDGGGGARAGAAAGTAPAGPAGETFTFAPFGTVHVYAPPGAPSQVVLFISGDGGWNLGVIPMARRLQAEGALVVGIDIRTFLASLERSGACAYPAGSLEELSRAVQLRHRLPEYHAPILVGYSSGATLVYAVLAQAPPETFRGAISLGFCPDVSLHTPLCRGRGLVSRPRAKGTRADLGAFAGMGVPWVVLQGDIDQVCAPAETARFVAQVGSARLVSLPKVGHGFSVTSRWEPQYVEAYRRIAAETTPAPPTPPTGAAAGQADDLSSLGLVEVTASGPGRDLMAVVLTGDGGWAEIDKRVAARLAESGIPVVGWSSLKYYWTPANAGGRSARPRPHPGTLREPLGQEARPPGRLLLRGRRAAVPRGPAVRRVAVPCGAGWPTRPLRAGLLRVPRGRLARGRDRPSLYRARGGPARSDARSLPARRGRG